MMNCVEPDKIDEMWPPEVAVWRASEDLYVKAYSIGASQIDPRYVVHARETLRLVLERLHRKEKELTLVAVTDENRDIGW